VHNFIQITEDEINVIRYTKNMLKNPRFYNSILSIISIPNMLSPRYSYEKISKKFKFTDLFFAQIKIVLFKIKKYIYMYVYTYNTTEF